MNKKLTQYGIFQAEIENRQLLQDINCNILSNLLEILIKLLNTHET